MSKGKREIWPISVSPDNPDVAVIVAALKDTPKGQRSVLLLHWAAAYLRGEANREPTMTDLLGASEDEIDSLLDDF